MARIQPGFIIRIIWVSDHPSQTRSLRSGGFNRSRSASELLHTQKTELPRLSTVCSGIPRHLPNDRFEFNYNNQMNARMIRVYINI